MKSLLYRRVFSTIRLISNIIKYEDKLKCRLTSVPLCLLITLVNTQNVSVNKTVDSPSIQCAESKYDLRIQLLVLVVMIHEVWLNA